MDVSTRALAARDARNVAKRLGDVAEQAANAAARARRTEQRELGLAGLDAATHALEAGGKQLQRLGTLGSDLGSVSLSELRRIQRAHARGDLTHAELAARHLAARLRRPEPSFVPVRGGSQRSVGAPPIQGEPSQAHERFNELAEELKQLAQEHLAEIGVVQRVLSDAQRAIDLTALRQQVQEHAEAILRAVSKLPLPGAEPGSARASTALAREHARSMAQSLRRINLSDAVQSGRDALSALGDAKRKAKDQRRPSDWIDRALLQAARRQLSQELAWAEQALEWIRVGTEARAKGALERASEREQGYSGRAYNLSSRGRNNETALPDDVIDDLERAGSVMGEAAGELADGKGERGLRLLREAQRLLERSHTGPTTDDTPSRPGKHKRGGGGGRPGAGMRTDGEVPTADRGEGVEDFQQRVLEGLGRGDGGRLAPAVKRYAEGLLR
jgi:hypothetical protein